MSDSKSTSKIMEAVPSTVVCPMLSSTNYTVWATRMKVLLRVHKVWESIEPRTNDEEKKDIAIALLFQSIPKNLILQVGEVDSSKEIWETVKSRNLGAERIKEARLQTLMNEFEPLGHAMEEPKLVKKCLNSLPRSKYIQIIASLEQVLDLNKTNFEDIVGRHNAYEERIQEEDTQETQKNLLCKKKGHFASACPEEEQDDQELNKADIEEADATLYMHEMVFLNEENVIPKTLVQNKREDGMWYLDNGASNHMTGERSYFFEFNESIKGKVKFGDGSCVDINGKRSILFEAKTGEHRLLTDIYYIPDLRSNILSLGQATEQGCDVRMMDNYLTLKDTNGRLLVKVLRSPNRLYKLRLEVGGPACLHTRMEEDT
ncbi:uncharacterized protein LOC103849223 [Brassica rapa]|uniref:uncharacterized protein LOC103849223 n=1 Tax=Brassica campestris TaxID=3711 RepID=UPI00142E66EB|nr:uncharacterized protein LOC103849223 [Brassica rapa]